MVANSLAIAASSIFSLAFLSSVAFGQIQEPSFSCPASIEVEQKSTSDIGGWDSANPLKGQPHHIRAASFYNGHPALLGELKPSQIDASDSGAGDRLIHGYVFAGQYPDGIWLACSYDLTSVMVFKRLPNVPSFCEIRYARELNSAPRIAMRCR